MKPSAFGFFVPAALLLAGLPRMSPAAAPLTQGYTGKGLEPAYLRCEYLVNPLGIQETAPRLSWIVESGERGQQQSAYRLLVASSEKPLTQGRGDLWDTGKVKSDETIGAPYAGEPLHSHERCFWQVKVWDKHGRESAWSKPALWTMGLLQPGDWHAEWIGYDKARQRKVLEAPLEGAKWIWHAADEPGKAPKGQRLFLTILNLPQDAKLKRAELFAGTQGGLRFVINGHQVVNRQPDEENQGQATRVDVLSRLHGGENEFRALVENDKEGQAGWVAKLVVTTEDGQTFTNVTDASWKSTDLLGSDWMGPTDAGPWPNARALADYGDESWGKLTAPEKFLPPAPYLRAQFVADKPVAHATLYATALGLVDFYLNGQRVSEDYFTPGWTDYAKRIYYRTYDVTELVRRGPNALGAVLADGWFSGYVGYRGARDLYGKSPRLRAQLHLEFADGSTADVGTGPGWKAAVGPVLEADFLQGESYDARQERAGWAEPGCDDSQWDPVLVGSEEVHPVLQAHPGPPVRAIQEFRAKSITEPNPGVFVLDLGQNSAGVPRLKITGDPGQKITLRFAERLNPDGTIYITNLRGARATDTYICKGGGLETWSPRFTFHGFQYIEISGLKEKPGADTVVGLALSSDTPLTGAFTCSDPMLNQLHNNIFWTQRANFIDIPTDCPQRDERLGWTGDAQCFVRTATLSTDVQPFFTKWLVDLEDGQRADGQFPCVAPVKVANNDGGPAWADAGVICPWTIYAVYGDRRELERHYESMARFIEFCERRSTPELLPPAKYHCYGDWLNINADTPKGVIYTAYFAHSTRLMAEAADALGRAEDASNYHALFQKIRAAFNGAYVAPDGRIKGDTQTGYVLALAGDLLDPENAKRAAEYLVKDIENRGWHLSTGFIGTKDLMLVLSKIGRADVAYRLLHNDTFPSWGFSIKHGATSIWERWNGWTPEKGFMDPGMNSFAHYSFGAVYRWMVENIGGIRSGAVAYKEIIIAPQMDPQLSSATVAYASIRGVVSSDWKILQKAGENHTGPVGKSLLLTVNIPANTRARIFLPAKSAANVTESGHRVTKARDVSIVQQDGEKVVLAIGSGKYLFEANLTSNLR